MAELSRIQIWLLASRPKTLWAAVAPVIIGTAMAYVESGLHVLSAIAALLGAVLIQIGTNFANDYHDYTHGTDTTERLGPLRVTQAGLVKPDTMKLAIVIVFALALLVGIYLVWRGGWPIVIIGLLSVLFGILYTGGPYPLGYNGLGEIFVLIFFGPVAVGGTYYVQALDINWPVIIAGLAPGFFSVAILTVNNYRDVDGDRQAGKKTLAARFGRNFARLEYLLSILLACLVPVALYFIHAGHFYSIAAVLTFFPAIPTIRKVFISIDGPTLNDCLAATGKLLLIYSLLFSFGWIL